MQKNNFAGYNIDFAPQAAKALKKLEQNIAKKVDEKLEELTKGAQNLDVIRMKGVEETYRLKFGDYRVIFEVKKRIITILVIDIAHRKEVYRKY